MLVVALGVILRDLVFLCETRSYGALGVNLRDLVSLVRDKRDWRFPLPGVNREDCGCLLLLLGKKTWAFVASAIRREDLRACALFTGV